MNENNLNALSLFSHQQHNVDKPECSQVGCLIIYFVSWFIKRASTLVEVAMLTWPILYGPTKPAVATISHYGWGWCRGGGGVGGGGVLFIYLYILFLNLIFIINLRAF